MSSQMKRISIACAVLFCALAGLVAAETVYAIHLRSRAKAFTERFEKLRISASKQEALGELSAFHGQQKPAELCDASGCNPGYSYEFRNALLPGALARSGAISAKLYFRNDAVVAKHLMMSSSTGCCFASIKEGADLPRRPASETADVLIQSNGTPYGVNVWLSPEVVNARREMAYRLNFNCLLPLSKCESAHKMLLTDWTE